MRVTMKLVGRATAASLIATVLLPLAATSAAAAAPRVAAKPAAAKANTAGIDALRLRALRDVDSWAAWLKANNAKGFVGEIGWPSDDPRWNTLANSWFNRANTAGLGVTTWVAGEWAAGQQLGGYVRSSHAVKWLDTARANATVAESHYGANDLRGVNSTGPEMGAVATEPTSTFSNVNIGRVDHEYHYDGIQSFRFLASRGVGTVRLPIRWERIQRTPYAPLDADEMARVRAMVHAARDAGLKVILDLHNFGGYYLHDAARGVGVRRAIGSAQLPVTAFTDVWAKLALFFAGDSAVTAFDLMNEPTGMAARGSTGASRLWEQASQQALNVIRATGDTRMIMVAGYQWSSMATWSSNHPVSWIKDPAANFRYEAHQYFDARGSGVYRSYEQELAAIKATS